MALYGLHQRESAKHVPLGQEIVANSTILNRNDPVTLDTDGFLILAGAGLRILGIMNEAYTAAADNETSLRYKAQFIEVDSSDLYEMDADDTITDTHRGMYGDVTGTTGAVLLDQSTLADATGQVRVAVLDPLQESSTTRVLVNVSELEALAYTQD